MKTLSSRPVDAIDTRQEPRIIAPEDAGKSNAVVLIVVALIIVALTVFALVSTSGGSPSDCPTAATCSIPK